MGFVKPAERPINTANYAAEVCQKPERAEAVALYIQHVLLHERVFPMPMQWPTYAWYSPQSPNYIDLGTDCGPMGGCWDTSYFHSVQALERVGLQEAIQRAVLRRAEVIHRDGDCLEYFRPDGTVDYSRHFVRSGYIVSGTAHVAAIIEGLFGVTPAKVGFEELNLRPNLPLYRRHRHSQFPSPWAQRDNRLTIALGPKGRLEMTVRCKRYRDAVAESQRDWRPGPCTVAGGSGGPSCYGPLGRH